MFGARKSVSSRTWRRQPARNEPNVASSPSKTFAPLSASASERWKWHEFPSRSSYLAMNVSDWPSSAAISFAPFL